MELGSGLDSHLSWVSAAYLEVEIPLSEIDSGKVLFHSTESSIGLGLDSVLVGHS